jgi:predicted transposase YbfD/YdcC
VAADATEDMAGLSVCESLVFLDYFKAMDDPRQSGKVRYPLDEILLLCLAAVISGAKTVSAIAQFGEMKLTFLRRFKLFKDGTPAHDHLGDILASLDPEAFQRCFVAWVSALIGAPVEAIAIDGKTQRRSGSKAKGQAAAHIVTAFAARQRLVLAQVKVDAKSNEIAAIPALIGMIDMTGAVVTIDAMGCQRAISERIVEKKADYVLALKGNQSALHDDVKTFVDEQKARNFADTTASRAETVDGDHGRIETRKFTVIHDVDWLQDRHKWPGLKGIVIVESVRESGDKIETETRLFITSSAMDAQRLAPFVRGHWAVENV